VTVPLLLNDRALLGTGVEVGVFAGEFSARFLWYWRGERLISIDPWVQSEGYDDISNVDPDAFEMLWITTCTRLQRFGKRSEVWRTTSEEGATRIDDASLDFVYIDARHDEASVLADLALWYPKVRPAGIIAGHDYVDGQLPEGQFGVKTAVDTFFGQRSLRVHVTGDSGFPSWIVEVPKDRG